jgi:hypothetical protein
LPEKKEKTKVSLSQLKIVIMMFDMRAMFPQIVSAAELGVLVEGILKVSAKQPSTLDLEGDGERTVFGRRNSKNDH